MKQCKKCKTNKETSKFYKDVKCSDGLGIWCKECDNKENKQRHIRNSLLHDDPGLIKNLLDYVNKWTQETQTNISDNIISLKKWKNE